MAIGGTGRNGGARAARVAAVLAVAALAAGCVSSPDDRGATEPQPAGPVVADLRGYRIDVAAGQSFEVRLPGDRGSGWRWELVDPVPAHVRTVDVARDGGVRGEIGGAPGVEAWRFEAAERGIGLLLFEYRRPAEPALAPAQRARFRVEVR